MNLKRPIYIIPFVFTLAFTFAVCQKPELYPPGFDFKLFSNTQASKLAKAVEIQDTAAIGELIRRDSVPVNFREEKFGNNLLNLSVANDKQLSSLKLLQLGANPNFRANDDASPFINACLYFTRLKNPEKVLSLLIEYGANVNSQQFDSTLDQFGKKKKYEVTALRLLCIYGNLKSFKLLINHGAILESKLINENSYISTALLSENLDLVKYLIAEKKCIVPEYCVIRQPGNTHEKKMTIPDLLDEMSFDNNSKKQKLKEEILFMLK